MFVVKNSLGQSHDIISQVVCEGDAVIDATAGKGHDTAFLAGLVGEKGRVYSFDIQEQALKRTKKLLLEKGLDARVNLVNDGHQNIDLYVREKVKAVMFNLGYLPEGDHSIGTKGCTTIMAVEKAMELLELNGVISIVVYYGGDSGFDEKEEVLQYIKTIDFKKFSVLQSQFVNQPNCPPIFVCIQKYSN